MTKVLTGLTGFTFLASLFMAVLVAMPASGQDFKIIEGDIIVGYRNSVTTAIWSGGDRWHPKPSMASVPFQVGDGIDDDVIASAVEEINTVAGGDLLVPRTNERDYISIVEGDVCNSWIGRQGGAQQLTLSPWCRPGAPIHEFLHALGMAHEQTRFDRDKHVIIHWENIKEKKEHNFQMRNGGVTIGPYDYKSIMHYGSDAFSKNGKDTITARNGDSTGGGELSVLDRTWIRFYYNRGISSGGGSGGGSGGRDPIGCIPTRVKPCP